MALREKRFCSVADLLRRQVEPTFRTLATVGFNVADSFLQLHAAGLCYRDISFGNLSFDPSGGDVVICDNDNVGVDGRREGGILGTPRFMAPEIVRGEAWPDSNTDRWALAVLLFYLLLMHHPLEGRREREEAAFDAAAMTRLYGTDPGFIFDPDDETNRPVAGEQDNAGTFWPLYPQELRQLFTRAFTDGLRDPRNGRVREGEWRQAMVAMRDAIVYCGSCGAENFADTHGHGPPRPVRPSCWSCGATLRLPLHLRLGRETVMLNHDTRLYPHHLDSRRLYDFSSPAAEVVSHPTNPNVWGLRNLGSRPWSASRPEGEDVTVDPGRTLPLRSGTQVHFGSTTGSVGSSTSG